MTRDAYLRRTYGITEDDFNKMLERQGGACAICGKRQRYQNLAVDHDHVTGLVRGLLCKRCNEGLGRFEYDDEVMYRLLQYVGDIRLARIIFAATKASEDA